MRRIQLKQIIREVIKEETFKGRRLNEAKSKFEEPTDKLIKQYVQGKVPPYEMSDYGELYFNGPATLDLNGGELPFALGHCANLTIVNAGSFANNALARCSIGNLTIKDSPKLKSLKGMVGRVRTSVTIYADITSLKGLPACDNGYYLETPKIKDFTGLSRQAVDYLIFRCPGGSSLKSLNGMVNTIYKDFEINGATSMVSIGDPENFPRGMEGNIIWKNNKMPLDPLDVYEFTEGEWDSPSKLISDTKWDKKARPLPKGRVKPTMTRL